MPSVFGHGLVGIVSACTARKTFKEISITKLIILSFLAANLPDFDVLFHHMGIHDLDFLAHRNFFHSIPFALAISPIFAFIYFKKFSILKKSLLAGYFFLLVMSHNLLDALTKGVGVALFYPFSKEQVSLPITPLPPAGFSFSEYQKAFIIEFQYIWIPCFLILLITLYLRKKRS